MMGVRCAVHSELACEPRVHPASTRIPVAACFASQLIKWGKLPLGCPTDMFSGTNTHMNNKMFARTSMRARGAVRHSAKLLHKGFTLIELMVVLVIIGLLAALIVPNVLDRVDTARETAARTDVANLMQALKLYKLDNQRFPTAEQGLQALITKPTAGPVPPNWKPYLEKLPNDPWSRPYQYVNPGVKGQIDVFSFGADGQAGGEGGDADIGSWQ
jgi:general secretion pathway protein G